MIHNTFNGSDAGRCAEFFYASPLWSSLPHSLSLTYPLSSPCVSPTPPLPRCSPASLLLPLAFSLGVSLCLSESLTLSPSPSLSLCLPVSLCPSLSLSLSPPPSLSLGPSPSVPLCLYLECLWCPLPSWSRACAGGRHNLCGTCSTTRAIKHGESNLMTLSVNRLMAIIIYLAWANPGHPSVSPIPRMWDQRG